MREQEVRESSGQTFSQPFFVNLPLRYIDRDRSYLELFAERNLNPELGLDAYALDQLDEKWHREVAAALTKSGLCCAIHLPFFDLQPGSLDRLILDATRKRLIRAVEIARLYNPRHLLGHAAFNEAIYAEYFSSWVSRAAETWTAALEQWPDRPSVYLENTYETEVGPLFDLMGELTELKVGFCFDVGHWYSFGNGRKRQDLGKWLETMRPHLRHLHLHDNDGSGDQHLGLGQGTIPWPALTQGLEALGISPSMTLEPHTREDLDYTMEFLKRYRVVPEEQRKKSLRE